MLPVLFVLPGGQAVYTYGTLLLLGLGSCAALSVWYARKERAPLAGLLVGGTAAFLGARLFWIVGALLHGETELQYLTQAGGLSGGGALFSGMVAAALFNTYKKRPVWPMMDVGTPGIALLTVILKVGCYSFGCDYGTALPTWTPAWVQRLGAFPARSPAWIDQVSEGVLSFEAGRSLPVHPVQLYEAVALAALFGLLLWLWPRRKFTGQLFLVFVVVLGSCRIAASFLYHDEGNAHSAWLWVAFILLAVTAYAWRRGRPSGSPTVGKRQ